MEIGRVEGMRGEMRNILQLPSSKQRNSLADCLSYHDCTDVHEL